MKTIGAQQVRPFMALIKSGIVKGWKFGTMPVCFLYMNGFSVRTVFNWMSAVALAAVLSACAGGGHAGSRAVTALPSPIPVKQMSHNDSLRFKMFYFEAVNQQTAGKFDAAYDLLRHCLEINPAAAEVHFLLSSYEGIFRGDSAAMAEIQMAAALDPSNTAYLERLGQGYIKTGNIKAAVDAYEKLATNSPERSDVLDILAELYAGLKDYDNMVRTIERIETLEGSTENTTLAKMRVYSLQGKKEEELKELKKMSEKHPNDLNYRVMMGNWLLQNGQPEKAYEEYRAVLDIEPENVLARMSMIDYYRTSSLKQQADSLLEMMLVSVKTPVANKMSLMRQVVADNEKAGGDSTEVLGLFKRVLAQKQKKSDMFELYAAYMTLKQMPKDSVAAALDSALNISPDNSGLRLQLIQIVWDKKDFDRVIELCREAMDYNPDEIVFYYFSGLAYVQKDDDDNALKVFRKGVAQLDDTSNASIASDFYAMIGDICHSKGMEKEAYAAYDSCLQWKDDNYACLNNYAYYLSEKGEQLDKAEQMSFRTVQAEPDNPTYLDTYAWILFKRGKYSEALPYIEMAVEKDTAKSAVLIEHEGDINAMAGNTEKAVELWEKALELSEKKDKVLIRKIKLKKYIDEE